MQEMRSEQSICSKPSNAYGSPDGRNNDSKHFESQHLVTNTTGRHSFYSNKRSFPDGKMGVGSIIGLKSLQVTYPTQADKRNYESKLRASENSMKDEYYTDRVSNPDKLPSIRKSHSSGIKIEV